ncbi:MAG: hypothetical protein ABEJ04_03795 [Halobacteriaceae archaeon]
MTSAQDETAAADAPKRLRLRFWLLVVTFDVALLATSVGAMLVAFEGRWGEGAPLFAVGVAAFAVGYYRYRRWRKG